MLEKNWKKRKELLADVASMYYIDRMSQQDIARELNTSRSNISRMLQLCVEQGIVEFKINGLGGGRVQRARKKIMERFALKDLRIAPTGRDYAATIQNIGKEAGDFLGDVMRDNMLVGITWGSTLIEVVRYYENTAAVSANVIQLAGGFSYKSHIADSYEISVQLAGKLHGECYLLRAPQFIENPVLKKMLMEEAEIKSHFDMFNEIDVILTGIGHTDPMYSALCRAGYLTDEQSEKLFVQGGIADLCGRQIYEDGSPCESEVSRRIVGITLEQIKRTPMTIAVAGGLNKKSCILAALRGGYIDALITDEDTALSIAGSADIHSPAP